MSDPHPFAPVPVRARRDGWTPARQCAFVTALGELRCVTAAARRVGMSWQGAYRLRERADAAGFAAAWDAALASPWDALAAAVATDGSGGRAIDGVAEPITWRGRVVGERRRYDDRLAIFLLRTYAPERYACSERRSGPNLSEAMARLEAELAASVAPSGGGDPSRDVDSGSSLSAPVALSQRSCDRDAQARPATPRVVRRHGMYSRDAPRRQIIAKPYPWSPLDESQATPRQSRVVRRVGLRDPPAGLGRLAASSRWPRAAFSLPDARTC